METNRHDRVAKTVTTAVLFAAFSSAFVNSVASVLVNDIIDEFALSGAAQGLLSSLMNAGVMVSLVAAPLFQGRIHKMTVLALAVGVQALMMLLTGLSGTFAMFSVWMVGLGMGFGIMDTYNNSCMVDVHPYDSGKFMGMLHGLFAIGSLVAPIPMQALLNAAGWRTVHYVIAVVMLLATLLVLYGRRTLPAAAPQMREEPLTVAALMAYLGKGRNVLLLLCGGMAAMMQVGLLCWVVRYMLVAHGNEAMGATCLTAYWVAATVNRFASPHLPFRRLPMVAVGAVVTAVCLAVGVWSHDAVVMCVCCALVGAFSGHQIPMIIDECARGYRGNTTLTTSVMMFVMGLGRVIMPLVVAAVSAATSVTVGMSLAVYASLLMALFALLVMRLPAPDPEEA